MIWPLMLWVSLVWTFDFYLNLPYRTVSSVFTLKDKQSDDVFKCLIKLMCGSCHTQSVLISVEYRNCLQTLDIYLLFAIWMGQMQSKLICIFVTYGLTSL